MSRITRKELKTNKFALEIGHTVTLFEEHRKEVVRYGGIALAIVVLAAGYMMYSNRRDSDREKTLTRAILVQEASVGPPTPGQNVNFPTQDLKDEAALKAFSEVRSPIP